MDRMVVGSNPGAGKIFFLVKSPFDGIDVELVLKASESVIMWQLSLVADSLWIEIEERMTVKIDT